MDNRFKKKYINVKFPEAGNQFYEAVHIHRKFKYLVIKEHNACNLLTNKLEKK